MIVGPEYYAILSVALGINKGDRPRIRSGLRAIVVGFLLAIVASLLFSLIVHAFNLQPTDFDRGIRPVSDLINSPNFFSVVVAVLAGVVGVVSLAEARTNALIGVFVSVTTIPAAADIGVSIAFASWREARGSSLQLLLNVVVLIVVGSIVLHFQRRVWHRISERRAAG
jgi:uncharacterized hydrophobic protein (TIGR00271 family)